MNLNTTRAAVGPQEHVENGYWPGHRLLQAGSISMKLGQASLRGRLPACTLKFPAPPSVVWQQVGFGNSLP